LDKKEEKINIKNENNNINKNSKKNENPLNNYKIYQEIFKDEGIENHDFENINEHLIKNEKKIEKNNFEDVENLYFEEDEENLYLDDDTIERIKIFLSSIQQ
jgi:hypothetical protein